MKIWVFQKLQSDEGLAFHSPDPLSLRTGYIQGKVFSHLWKDLICVILQTRSIVYEGCLSYLNIYLSMMLLVEIHMYDLLSC